MAKEVGANFALNITSKEPKEVAKMVIDALGGKVDVTIDSTGLQGAIQTGIYVSFQQNYKLFFYY